MAEKSDQETQNFMKLYVFSSDEDEMEEEEDEEEEEESEPEPSPGKGGVKKIKGNFNKKGDSKEKAEGNPAECQQQ